MSITNPSTPNSYKPPTPVQQSCTSNALQGPKTPQSHPGITGIGDQKFAVPSPPVSSQPQLIRQQSLPTVPNRPDGSCHLAPQGTLTFLNINFHRL